MKLKITWDEYKAFAMQAIQQKYGNAVDDDTVIFMRRNGYEPDSEVCDIPEYVEINLD